MSTGPHTFGPLPHEDPFALVARGSLLLTLLLTLLLGPLGCELGQYGSKVSPAPQQRCGSSADCPQDMICRHSTCTYGEAIPDGGVSDSAPLDDADGDAGQERSDLAGGDVARPTDEDGSAGQDRGRDDGSAGQDRGGDDGSAGQDDGGDAGDAGGAVADAGSPEEQLRQSFIDAVCERDRRCIVERGLRYASDDACRAYLYQLLSCDRYGNPPPTLVEPETLTCIDVLAVSTCDQPAGLLSPCDVAIQYPGQSGGAARVGVGESCERGWCAPDTYCRSYPTGTCSVCVPSAVEGEFCGPNSSGSWVPCAQELECTDNVCAPRREVGEACMDNHECATWFCQEQVCAETPPPGSEGEPCGGATGASCNDGLICRSGTCARLAQVGEACVGYQDCLTGAFCRDEVCVAYEASCAPRALGDHCLPSCVEGAGCGEDQLCVPDQTDPRPCASDIDCALVELCDVNTSTCIPGAAEGDACLEQSLCAEGLHCHFDADAAQPYTCRAPQPDGTACESGFECLSDYCDLHAGGLCASEESCTVP